MREKKKFPALPLGLKSEVLETRMKFHRISRGTRYSRLSKDIDRAFTVQKPRNQVLVFYTF